MICIFKQDNSHYGILKKNIETLDIEYESINLEKYDRLTENLNTEFVPSAVVYGLWYGNCLEIDKSVETTIDYNKIDLVSVSGNIHASYNFDSEIAKNLKIVPCHVCTEYEEYSDEDKERYTCISINDQPSFLIEHHLWNQFERFVISNDDRYIVLVWSRYICVFDIHNKCCIYLSDGEMNGIVNEEIYTSFQDMRSSESHKNGITIKYTVSNENEETCDQTIIFL
jgi:hypothetical protein